MCPQLAERLGDKIGLRVIAGLREMLAPTIAALTDIFEKFKEEGAEFPVHAGEDEARKEIFSIGVRWPGTTTK